MKTATLLLLPLFFVANIAGVYVGLDWADVATEPGRA